MDATESRETVPALHGESCPPDTLHVWHTNNVSGAWRTLMMMYDLLCIECGYLKEDFLQRVGMREPPYTCPCCHQKTLTRTLIKAPGVIGDEIDITIRHGLCNADGSPRRYRSKAEIKLVAKQRNLVNQVRHTGRKGGDKSKTTQRFI